MIKALLFDCFGVIVGQGFEHTYQLAGGDPKRDRQFIEDKLGQANLGMISEAAFNQAIVARLGITGEAWQQAILAAEQPDKQLLDYIEGLRSRYKTAILSNANTGVMSGKIGDGNLVRCFDGVIVSAEIGLVKPQPEIYHHAAEQLGVELAECIFVDDRQVHLDPAAKLGMHTILYKDFTQMRSEIGAILNDSKN